MHPNYHNHLLSHIFTAWWTRLRTKRLPPPRFVAKCLENLYGYSYALKPWAIAKARLLEASSSVGVESFSKDPHLNMVSTQQSLPKRLILERIVHTHRNLKSIRVFLFKMMKIWTMNKLSYIMYIIKQFKFSESSIKVFIIIIRL